MAKKFYPEEEPMEVYEPPIAAPKPEKKKVDLKAWRERKLMVINKMPDAGKAKRAAERVFRNKEA